MEEKPRLRQEEGQELPGCPPGPPRYVRGTRGGEGAGGPGKGALGLGGEEKPPPARPRGGPPPLSLGWQGAGGAGRGGAGAASPPSLPAPPILQPARSSELRLRRREREREREQRPEREREQRGQREREQRPRQQPREQRRRRASRVPGLAAGRPPPPPACPGPRGPPAARATLKFLAVLLAAGMLAFLGAIVCIIASVHPAASPAGPPAAGANASSAGAAARRPPGPEQSLSALHGPGASAGPPAPPAAGGGELLASARPRPQPLLFSRFLCTPLASECPTAADGAAGGAAAEPGPGGPREEELRALQSAAEQLRQTALQQKARIRADQEAIRELTGKLGRCESGLRAPPGPGPDGRQDALSDGPAWDAPGLVRELEEAVRALKDRIEKIEQELPVHGNVSSATSQPLPTQDPLHTQMENLEAQLLSKVMALEKERSSLSSSNHKQQQVVEKELSALQERVSELEHGASAYSSPDAFKINIPVKNNYMYARVRRTLPELYSFTICMWLKSKSGGMGIGTPFSYSVPGQSNEMVLLEAGHDPMELLINDKVAQLPLNLKDGRWHHICIVWTTRDGLWSAYQDGQLRGSSDNLAAWHPIKPHGVIILGQEQDTLGGRFDATQAFVGEIAQFNLWDHILTPAQILGIANCTSPLLGNIIPWDDKLIEAFGGATKLDFDSCKSKAKAKAKAKA